MREPSRPESEALAPWIDVMLAVDRAEADGDADEALRLMQAHAVDQAGRQFWRPCRFERLAQVLLLGSDLPGWAVSRWLVAQAHNALYRPRDRWRTRAEQLSLDVVGGLERVSRRGDTEARCQLIDRNWVYRQVFTYDLGGLARFVRSNAGPKLVARADRIHDWARAPISGLRLVSLSASSVTWARLDTGELLEHANIGSAIFVEVGESVLGRVVPILGGTMLEGAPLVVPEEVAAKVAADPSSWLTAIRESRAEIETLGFEPAVLHDVPTPVWEAMLSRSPSAAALSECSASLARRALETARECLDGAVSAGPASVDRWSCVRAALSSRSVVARVPEIATAEDVEVVRRLSEIVAPPTDIVGRRLVELLKDG
ncbi:MAG TPA: hypothetical protein VHW64_18270 [Nocardioides sp.]|uniref:hypothetical protein n=1 Tax=Nocardioides sp. TaxID=35761 RepID=UPI002E37548B|nr:hypothetical protein [Nocardioides sp.]HEX3932647.1 hypothetical protein [Nocardioides sp.]